MAEATSDVAGIVKGLQEKHGKDSVVLGSSGVDSVVRGYLSTQCPQLDYCIGRPGIPLGRLTTIVGQEGAGKSSLAQHILAETQRLGGIAILADTEHRFWAARAQAIGVDVDNLIHLVPVSLEDALGQIESAVQHTREHAPDVPVALVVDSIAGAPTKADLELKYGDTLPASHARLMALAMRRIHPAIARSRIALVFINQLRTKLEFGHWGKPELVMLAEKTINYWSSLKIYVEQGQRLGEKDTPSGVRVNCRILESRISPREGWRCTFDVDFQKGIDRLGSALDLLAGIGVIEFNRGWFSYEGRKFHRADFQAVWDACPELAGFVAAAPTLWTQADTPVAADEGTED